MTKRRQAADVLASVLAFSKDERALQRYLTAPVSRYVALSLSLSSTAQMQPLRFIELLIMWCLYCLVLYIIGRRISFLSSFLRTRLQPSVVVVEPHPVINDRNHLLHFITVAVLHALYGSDTTLRTYVHTYVHMCMHASPSWGWRCTMNQLLLREDREGNWSR